MEVRAQGKVERGSGLRKRRLSCGIAMHEVGKNILAIPGGWSCFTKKITYAGGYPFEGAEYTGNFSCSLFNSCPGCPHALKADDKRIGFPFNLTAPLGEGGFATVFRGEFHGGKVAFKFIPIKKDGYEYAYNSVGIWEYYQQEKINKKK